MRNIFRNVSFALFFLLLSVFRTFGQGIKSNEIKLPDPQPPNAAELGKYGNYPTAEFTGVVPISIPLFEISLHGKILPFSLNYHASGIKVSQQETEFGLGWSMSGIYTISRSVMSGPDERRINSYEGVYFQNPKTGPELVNQYFVPVPNTPQGTILSKIMFLRSLAEGSTDMHSDIYQYSTRSNSGKFLVKNMNEYITIPKASVKISRGTIRNDSYNSYPFNLSDDNGLNYLFDEISYAVGDEIYSGKTNIANVNTWYISKITDNESGNQAEFLYESNWLREYSTYEEYKIGYEFTGQGNGISVINPMTSTASSFVDQNNKLLKTINHSNGRVEFEYLSISAPIYTARKFVNKITLFNLKNEIVRQFELFYDRSTDRVKLVRVETKDILDPNKSSSYKFGYNITPLPSKVSKSVDYWGYYNNGANSSYIPQVIVGSGDIPQLLPGPPISFSVGSADRNPNAQYTQAEILNKITYPTGGYSEFEYENNKYLGKKTEFINQYISESAQGLGVNVKNEIIKNFTFSNVPLLPNEQPKISITFNPPTPIFTERAERPQLVTITDLTEGKIILQKWHNSDLSKQLIIVENINLKPNNNYQLKIVVYGISTPLTNYFSTTTSVDITWRIPQVLDIEKLAGGLRVKSISSFSASGELANKEEYKYGANESGLGHNLFEESIFYKNYQDQSYYAFYEQGVGPGTAVITGTANWWQRKYFGLTGYSSASTGGASVVYDKINKISRDANNVSNFSIVESSYKINKNLSFSGINFLNSQNYGGMAYLLEDPLLEKREKFLVRNNIKYPITLESISYTNDIVEYTAPLIFEKRYFDFAMGLEKGTAFRDDYYADFYLSGSSFSTSFRKPTQKILKSYYYNELFSKKDSVESNQNMEYNAVYADQPSKIITLTSDGSKQSIQEFTYADDFTNYVDLGLSTTLQEQSSLGSYKKAGLHYPNRPIRIKLYKGGSLLKSEFNIPNNYNNKVFMGRNITLNGSDIINMVKINLYDSYGNPQEIQKQSQSVVTYLWAYNGQYPIAEIKNATYAEVLAVLTQATINSLNSTSQTEASMEILIKNAGDKLRNDLPKGMVTSYTYRPLVGMKSKTDPRGVTEYYEYDGMQRLKAVLDKFKNVTSALDYHYRPN